MSSSNKKSQINKVSLEDLPGHADKVSVKHLEQLGILGSLKPGPNTLLGERQAAPNQNGYEAVYADEYDDEFAVRSTRKKLMFKDGPFQYSHDYDFQFAFDCNCLSTSIYNADLLPLGKGAPPIAYYGKKQSSRDINNPSQSDYGLARVPLVPKSTSPQKLAFASHFMHYPGQWVTPKAYSWPRIDKGRTRFDSPDNSGTDPSRRPTAVHLNLPVYKIDSVRRSMSDNPIQASLVAPLVFSPLEANTVDWKPLIVYSKLNPDDENDFPKAGCAACPPKIPKDQNFDSLRQLMNSGRQVEFLSVMKKEATLLACLVAPQTAVLINMKSLARFNKTNRYLNSEAAKRSLRTLYYILADPQSKTNREDVVNELLYTSHTMQRRGLKSGVPPDTTKFKTADEWRQKVFEENKTTMPVMVTDLYIEVSRLMLDFKLRQTLMESIHATSELYGPSFFHDRLRMLMFDDLVNAHPSIPTMPEIFQDITRGKLQTVVSLMDKGEFIWNPLPCTYENWAHFHDAFCLSLINQFGTSISADIPIAAWPHNLAQLSLFNKNFRMFTYKFYTKHQDAGKVFKAVHAENTKIVGDKRNMDMTRVPYKYYSEKLNRLNSDDFSKSPDFFDYSNIEKLDMGLTDMYALMTTAQYTKMIGENISFHTFSPATGEDHPKWGRFNVNPHLKKIKHDVLLTYAIKEKTTKSTIYETMSTLRTRYDKCQLDFVSLHAHKVGQGLSNLDVKDLYAFDEVTVRKFITHVWKEYLRPLKAFFSAHSNIKPQTLVALWLYSVITTGVDNGTTKHLPVFGHVELMTRYPVLGRVFSMYYDLGIEPTAYTLKTMFKGNSSYYSLVSKDLFLNQYGWGSDACVQPVGQPQMQLMEASAPKSWTFVNSGKHDKKVGDYLTDEQMRERSGLKENETVLACGCQMRLGLGDYVSRRNEAH